ncbi:MAG: hypothetical protein VXW58_01895, partial [Pseudomonadota bacterium]|nr:hypothetical protein [Pseudomonadota bacterium]
MLMKFRKASAPAVLALSSVVLRQRGLSPNAKISLWKSLQKFVTFFDVPKTARISNGMQMQVSSNPRVEQEI